MTLEALDLNDAPFDAKDRGLRPNGGFGYAETR